MPNINFAFDTIIVGLLTIPWLLLFLYLAPFRTKLIKQLQELIEKLSHGTLSQTCCYLARLTATAVRRHSSCHLRDGDAVWRKHVLLRRELDSVAHPGHRSEQWPPGWGCHPGVGWLSGGVPSALYEGFPVPFPARGVCGISSWPTSSLIKGNKRPPRPLLW